MNSTDWLHLGLALAAIFIPFALGFLLVAWRTGGAQPSPEDSEDAI